VFANALPIPEVDENCIIFFSFPSIRTHKRVLQKYSGISARFSLSTAVRKPKEFRVVKSEIKTKTKKSSEDNFAIEWQEKQKPRNYIQSPAPRGNDLLKKNVSH
jgi:hypothetical protein